MSAKSVYRVLLAFYPAAFREEYGSQMTLAFTEQLGEARRSGTNGGVLCSYGQAPCWTP